MWTTEFKSYANSETVGNIKATCGHFTFESTINLGDKGSVEDFILQAKAALIKSEEPIPTIVVDELEKITNNLNK